jgi:PAT family beta-lactamase induction signal transducer AmpG
VTLNDTFKTYLDKRILWVFLMGCASGFPWVLIGSAMSGWLKDAGLTRTAIGLFGSIFAVYAINFFWAPLLDRVKIPMLGVFGQRRGWILFTQLVMLVLTVSIATVDPAKSLMLTSLLAFGIALASATQDIAVDAYRIDHFANSPKHQLPAASAMAVIGWWTGYSLPGYVAFRYADTLTWSGVYCILAGFIVCLIGLTLTVQEPESDRTKLQSALESKYDKFGTSSFGQILRWLTVTIWEPLAEFMRRNGVKTALAILLFVFLFKIGEAFLGRMSIVFYKEVGFTNEQIADYTKMLGWFATVAFTLLGSIINVRLGVVKGLLIGGASMALSNLMFAWIAVSGPQEWLFAAAIIVDNFTTAFSSVAFVSFLTALTGRAFSATQYALLASIGNLGRTTLAGGSGWFVDVTGSWVLFFILTTVLVIPGLILLIIIRDRIKTLESEQTNG